jgi:hypothetical protein
MTPMMPITAMVLFIPLNGLDFSPRTGAGASADFEGISWRECALIENENGSLNKLWQLSHMQQQNCRFRKGSVLANRAYTHETIAHQKGEKVSLTAG